MTNPFVQISVDSSEGLTHGKSIDKKLGYDRSERLTQEDILENNKRSNTPHMNGVLYYTEDTSADQIYRDNPNPYILSQTA
jgi:hypothetical protein